MHVTQLPLTIPHCTHTYIEILGEKSIVKWAQHRKSYTKLNEMSVLWHLKREEEMGEKLNKPCSLNCPDFKLGNPVLISQGGCKI